MVSKNGMVAERNAGERNVFELDSERIDVDTYKRAEDLQVSTPRADDVCDGHNGQGLAEIPAGDSTTTAPTPGILCAKCGKPLAHVATAAIPDSGVNYECADCFWVSTRSTPKAAKVGKNTHCVDCGVELTKENAYLNAYGYFLSRCRKCECARKKAAYKDKKQAA